MTKHRVPGPSRLQLLRALPRLRVQLVETLRDYSEQYGEAYLLPLRLPTYVLSNPDDIKHILVANPRNYHKTGGLTVGKELFGNGLVSSEAPLHTRQRRLMQPMFHRSSIANFAKLMTDSTLEHVADWKEGDTVDLPSEMMRLTLTIVGRALFSADLFRDSAELGNAFTVAQRLITRRQQRVPIPVWLPTPANRQYKRVMAQIDASISKLIADRRRVPESERPNDLLTMLLAARFEDGSEMEPAQIRDEATTLMMAGHETVANNLNWTWYLLHLNRDADARLAEEWRDLLGGRPPGLAELPQMQYTEMVLAESMRLYPPAWTLARRVIEQDSLPSGLVLPAGSEVILTQYIFHRNGKYFPEPDRFMPERFHPEAKAERPAYAYFPFGGGPRYCIGESFARMESAMVLAIIGQRFRLEVEPGQKIGLEPLITLRPRYGLRMRLVARGGEVMGKPGLVAAGVSAPACPHAA